MTKISPHVLNAQSLDFWIWERELCERHVVAHWNHRRQNQNNQYRRKWYGDRVREAIACVRKCCEEIKRLQNNV